MAKKKLIIEMRLNEYEMRDRNRNVPWTAEELARDAAVREADTLLLTVPNQLGVAYNARLLATIAEHVAPAVGWQPASRR